MKYCRCGESIEPERIALGYYICIECGEEKAKRKIRTIVPLNKSNYVLVTNIEDLKSLDPKHRL